MKLINIDRGKRSASAILFFGTFLMHFSWTIYVSNEEGFLRIIELQKIISKSFHHFPGFEWEGFGAYVVTAALVSSFAANLVRRFLEGFFFGWPRFKDHDKDSLTRASMLLVGYGLMMYFAIGFFGEKYSSRPLDTINIFLIAVSTYIAGLLVDFIDDILSGFYHAYSGGKV